MGGITKKTSDGNVFEEINADLVVVSDIHLRGPEDQRCQLLLDILDRARLGRVKTFILLGDIFDFCIGGPAYYRQKYAALGAKLEALAAKGTRVIFLEGNHEFSMAGMAWEGVEIVSDEAMFIDVGVRIAIRHGDLLDAPASYRAFRLTLKSPVVLAIARAVPPGLLETYALSHAKVSRSRDQYRHLNHKKLIAAAEKWLVETSATHGIFGHFHVPYAEAAPDRGCGMGKILSLCSWDTPNFLAFENGIFSRGEYDAEIKQWRRTTPVPTLDTVAIGI